MPEIPESENCCAKEPYAFYGLTSYAAQLMEHSALNVVLALKLPEVGLCTVQVFDEISVNLEKRTFGQLLGACKKEIDLSDEELELLNEALNLRNYVTHHFFRAHATNFVSEAGQKEMIDEMRGLIAKFDKADAVLERIYKPLWQQYGYTEENAEAEIAKMLQEAKERDTIA